MPEEATNIDPAAFERDVKRFFMWRLVGVLVRLGACLRVLCVFVC